MNAKSRITILVLALCAFSPCRAEDPPPPAAPTPAVPTPAVPQKKPAPPVPAAPKKKPAAVKKVVPPPPAFPGHTPLFNWLMTNHDINHDRKIDPSERAAVNQAFLKKDFMAVKLDVNANNTIDADELDRLVNEPVAVPQVKKPAPKKPAPKKPKAKG